MAACPRSRMPRNKRGYTSLFAQLQGEYNLAGVPLSVSFATTRKEPRMPTFKLPLSGDVTQSINPFTAFMTGGQFGLVNINLGQSTAPKVEAEVLSDIATYGKQLGRIGDALLVLLRHLPATAQLSDAEAHAISDLKSMLHEIANVKEDHGARHVLRPPP